MAGANERSREIGRSNSFVFPTEEEDEEIELTLGLSLGGRFGVDKSSKLVRSSSSVVVSMPLFREEHHQPVETSVARLTGLSRTTSLPVESEEEWRKRKEMQSLRRMAAKKRRSEKLRIGGGSGGSGIKLEEANNDNVPGEGSTCSRRRGRPLSGLPRWSATVNKGGLLRQNSAGHDSLQGSLGSGSSVSELETKSYQASSEEARSLPLTQQHHQHEAMGSMPNNRLRRLSSVDMKIEPPPPQGTGKNEMPCVFTNGPNGKRVDGILYRYGNGEEVMIMCVCHGEFLSPAEFVQHAGGPHVDHPLRHIVVSTSSPSNLF